MNAWLLHAGMQWYGATLWRPVERLTKRPRAAQARILQRILAANRDTRFGNDHGFRDLRDIETFQHNVPVQDYEQLQPFIEEQRRTGHPVLTTEPPLFYTQTSGSTATPKHIPVTATSLAMHRREQALFSYLQYRACPAAFNGKGLGIMGAAAEGRLDSGHVVGSVSGHLYESLPSTVRSRFVVPPVVSTIADYEVKYRTVLALALAEPSITYLGTPNPSTLLRLVTLMNVERDRLLDVVATGRFDAIEGIPADVLKVLKVAPNAARAEQLRRISTLNYATAWPDIRLVTTWTGGSVGIALDALRRELPTGAAVMELGYQATEVRGTMAVDLNSSAGLPALHHHFFEFAEQNAWDAGNRTCVTLEHLEERRQYYVIVTTAAGLYRYFMNDLLSVEGRLHETPLLRFVQKGKGVTNLTGEKLYEAQAIAAVQHGARALGFDPAFFLMVANEQHNGYELLIEVDGAGLDRLAIAAAVDRHLEEGNIEYHAKRASGRLKPLTVIFLRRGAAEAHKTACVLAGQREAQFKPTVLQYGKDLRWQADEYVLR
jgi:hypothetical protein